MPALPYITSQERTPAIMDTLTAIAALCYHLATKDPIWRELAMDIGGRLMDWSEKAGSVAFDAAHWLANRAVFRPVQRVTDFALAEIFASYAYRLASFVPGKIGDMIWDFGYEGSAAEVEFAAEYFDCPGLVPWRGLTPRQQEIVADLRFWSGCAPLLLPPPVNNVNPSIRSPIADR